MRLLMISGRSAAETARGAHNAFFYTLDFLRTQFDSIDVIYPGKPASSASPFDNVFFHGISALLFLRPFVIKMTTDRIMILRKIDRLTVEEHAPFVNGFAAWLVSRRYGIPYMLEIHHVVGHPRAATLREWFERLFVRCFFRFDALAASRVRVVNARQVPDFLVNSGVPRGKIMRLPSVYLDNRRLRPDNQAKRFDLVWVGRLAPNKRIDIFLELVRRLTSVKALVIGVGPLLSRSKRRAEALGIRQRVTFAEFVSDDEYVRLLCSSRVLVLTSANEGGPRVVCEALACGVPVVASPVGLVPEFAERGALVMVPDWKIDTYAVEITSLLRDDARYSRLRMTGIEVASKIDGQGNLRAYAEALRNLS